MDYEKLHKDTIAKLQQMVNSGQITIETARSICADFIQENENERIKKAIEYAISQSTHSDGTLINGVSSEEVFSWLEKQCDKKPTWSEEDIAMLDSAIAFVEHSAFTTIGKGKSSVVAWLKSLKDRYTWKPSNEQMETCETPSNSIKKIMPILKFFYQDLEKPMEE